MTSPAKKEKTIRLDGRTTTSAGRATDPGRRGVGDTPTQEENTVHSQSYSGGLSPEGTGGWVTTIRQNVGINKENIDNGLKNFIIKFF